MVQGTKPALRLHKHALLMQHGMNAQYIATANAMLQVELSSCQDAEELEVPASWLRNDDENKTAKWQTRTYASRILDVSQRRSALVL